MARRRENATVQLNLRVTPQVFRELETRAKAHGITVSEEVRRKLAADQSLASYLANFEREMRDAVEASVRGSRNPEPTFRLLATFGAKVRKTYTDFEELLLPHMTIPKVRELMRSSQQE
jgi:hypothetical protein